MKTVFAVNYTIPENVAEGSNFTVMKTLNNSSNVVEAIGETITQTTNTGYA